MRSWVLDHLEKMNAFHAIVKSGSLVRAALELGVSQPALSRLVTSLEVASGKILLERTRLGCVPTAEGRELVRFFERLQPMADDLAQRVESGDQLSGRLVIASFESFTVTWWPEFVKTLSCELPFLKLAIRTASPESHREKLLNGSVDLVIEASPELHESVTSFKVASESFALYVAKKIEDEESLPLVYVPSAKDENGVPLYELLRAKSLTDREVFELDSFATAYEFISAGIGIGPLPKQMFNKYASHSKIRLANSLRGSFGAHSICVSLLCQNRTDQRIVELIRRLKAHLHS